MKPLWLAVGQPDDLSWKSSEKTSIPSPEAGDKEAVEGPGVPATVGVGEGASGEALRVAVPAAVIVGETGAPPVAGGPEDPPCRKTTAATTRPPTSRATAPSVVKRRMCVRGFDGAPSGCGPCGYAHAG
jgi:hypothetical protein